jgi:hypothetical protein
MSNNKKETPEPQRGAQPVAKPDAIMPSGSKKAPAKL